MKTLKPASKNTNIVATFILCAVGAGLLANAVLLFFRGHPYTALKIVGLSVICLSGCFDPVNLLLNFSPFVAGDFVQPSRYAQYFWPCACIGFLLIGIGWFGDGWLPHPPAEILAPVGK